MADIKVADIKAPEPRPMGETADPAEEAKAQAEFEARTARAEAKEAAAQRQALADRWRDGVLHGWRLRIAHDNAWYLLDHTKPGMVVDERMLETLRLALMGQSFWTECACGHEAEIARLKREIDVLRWEVIGG